MGNPARAGEVRAFDRDYAWCGTRRKDMFADACAKASTWTSPVVISTWTWRGTVSSDFGAFVVLNEDGWFATAAHVISSYMAWQHAALFGSSEAVRTVAIGGLRIMACS